MARVFISHAAEDSDVGADIHAWTVEAGHEAFLDRDLRDGISLGDEWERRLHERLRWADAVICVVTAAYRASTWCSAEVGIARSRGSLLLPVRAEPGAGHPLMSMLQWTDLSTDPDAARATLGAALERIDRSGGRGWPDGHSPFPGLRPFDLELRQAFFGRDDDVDRLAALIRSPAASVESSTVLVIGPSGCGKSSLIRAGLLPLISTEPGWSVLPAFVPGADPVTALARELSAAAREVGLAWTPAEVRERLGQHRLTDMADELLIASPGGRRKALLIAVDQTEELITQAPPDARAAFAGLLASARNGPVRVVATMRPEFLATSLADPDLAPLAARSYTLRPLRRESLRSVIEGPARLAGLRVSDELVARLVDDAGSGSALPLLAFVLAQLAEGLHRGDELSAARYEQLGGVQGALIRQADAALAEAMVAGRRKEEDVVAGLLRLVTVDEQLRPTRWRVPRGELSETVLTELDAFVARRILVSDSDGDVPVIEVAHEEFLEAWPPLAAAITNRSSALRARRDVEQAAADWVAAGRPRQRLWGGGQLAAVVSATGIDQPPASRPVELGPAATEFLRTSMRIDRLRRGRLVAVLSALLLAALAAAGVAFVQQTKANRQLATATARQLIAQADAVVDTDPRTALRLGIAARRLDDSGETRSWLDSVFSATPFAGRLFERTVDPLGDTPRSVAISPDGRTLAAGRSKYQEDGRVVLWDLADPAGPRQLGEPLRAPGIPVVAFSVDGARLTAASGDGGVAMWDVSDRERPRPLGEPVTGSGSTTGGAVAFSGGGSLLAIGSGAAVQLWSLAGPAPSPIGSPLTGHARDVGALAFSPDSRTLAVVTGFEKPVLLWDVTNPDRPVPLGQPVVDRAAIDVFHSVAFAPNGHTLALGGSTLGAGIWDVTDPRNPRPVGQRITSSGYFTHVAFDPVSGELVTFGSGRGSTFFWDITDPTSARSTTALPAAGGLSATFTPDGATMAFAGPEADRMVELWTVRGHGQPRAVGPPLVGHRDDVFVARFSPDGNVLATGGKDRTVVLWDVQDRSHPSRLGPPLSGHPHEIRALAFSPDGRTLAVGSSTGTEPGSVSLWDVSAPARPVILGEPIGLGDGGWGAMTFSADGAVLSVGSYPPTFFDVRDLTRPRRITELPDQQVAAFQVTDAGRILAVLRTAGRSSTMGDEPGSRLWDVTQPAAARQVGAALREDDGRAGALGQVITAALSADGERLVTADSQRAIVWDLTDPQHPGRLGRPIEAHGGTGFDVALDRDGYLLATAGIDGTAILWSLDDPARPRTLARPLEGHRDAIRDVTFSPDGNTLVTTGNDGPVVLWDLTPLRELRAHTLERACVVAGALDREEWGRYLPGREYVDTCAA